IPGDAAPGNPPVGHLLGDLRVPFLFLAPARRAPMRMRIIDLLHFLHAGHEPRKLFELRPLVVDRSDRAVHLYRFLDPFHFLASLRWPERRNASSVPWNGSDRALLAVGRAARRAQRALDVAPIG